MLDFRYIGDPQNQESQRCILILLEGDQNFLFISEIVAGIEGKQSPPFRVIFTQGPLPTSAQINNLEIFKFLTTEALEGFLQERGFI